MPDPLQRNYELARALLDALPASVGLTAAQFEAAAGQLLKRGYRLSADPVDEIVAEHALEMSGGGMHVRADGLDEVYPLGQWIADQQRHARGCTGGGSSSSTTGRRCPVAELDIAAFLRARLDEREAVALAATPGPWESEGDDPTDDEVYTVHDGEHGDLIGNVVAFARGGDRQQPNTVHIADNDPEFALADVAAKRRILALHEPTFPPDGPIHGVHWEHVHVRGANGEIIGDREFAVENDEPDPPDWCGQCAEGRCAPCPTLRLLALLYSGHPDYREEWR